jgi:hypothetical protein
VRGGGKGATREGVAATRAEAVVAAQARKVVAARAGEVAAARAEAAVAGRRPERRRRGGRWRGLGAGPAGGCWTQVRPAAVGHY